MSNSNFYRSFEDRHRGSRDLIRDRLKVYLPFIEPLLVDDAKATALDLGCGRGEWLELLRDSGFDAQGVDMDEGMLAACTERGLNVQQGDAISALKHLPDQSLSIVSGFHFAEHIPFDVLDELVAHAHRVLRPGGLLILETPNPENLVVGTSSFYLDPTHVRPIPPLLLSFLPEYHGYARVQIVRLQEDPALRALHEVGLMQVLEGVSPDYAIVAQKSASPEILDRFACAFRHPYGVELRDLAGRFDAFVQERIQTALNASETIREHVDAVDHRVGMLEQRAGESERRANEAERRINDAEHRVNESERRFNAAEQNRLELEGRLSQIEKFWEADVHRRTSEYVNAHGRNDSLTARFDERQQLTIAEIHRLEEIIRHLERERDDLRSSLSWKVTAPARWSLNAVKKPVNAARRSANFVLGGAINLFQRPLASLMALVLRKPQLSERLNHMLLRFPALHRHLLQISQVQGVMAPSSGAQATTLDQVVSLEDLPPRARRIYEALTTNDEEKGWEENKCES